MTSISIGIAYHKEANFYNVYPFIPIQVGSNMNNKDLGIQKDSDGDNISHLNPYCCELSATYWLWKNNKSKYKGLFHYRRFMSFEKKSILYRLPYMFVYFASKLLSPFVRDARYGYMSFSTEHLKDSDISSFLYKFGKQLETDIENNGIECYSLDKIYQSTNRIRTVLLNSIGLWHLSYAEKMIREKYPSFYEYFEKSLNGNCFYSCNMIIAKDAIYDEYCELMFSIIQDYINYMNGSLPTNNINNSMFRDAGYLGEIITDAYIKMIKDRGVKVKHLGMAMVDVETGFESQKVTSVYGRIKELLK